ncbi:MAG: thiol-disulfide oxidoreductase DCC family protein [Bacteroidia bacterium]|nr:thiol-disulfide oxidoreductase DCC family protein [Bacteroidia bacterium]
MGALDPVEPNHVILFDGLCNLCSGSVQFIIRRDSKEHFRFAALQSPFGQYQLHKFGLTTNQLYSIILIKDEKYFQKSDAALEITRDLDRFWPALYIFKIIPRFMRDWVYTIVATNRYTWFGKKDSCMIPTPQLKSRFLDNEVTL